jgi:serine protease Do
MKLTRSNVTLALLLFCAGLLIANFVNHPGIARAASPLPVALDIPSPVQLSNSFRKIAKEAEPSVVQITSTIEEKRQPTQFMFRGNPFGNMIPFGNGNGNPFEGAPGGMQRSRGLGSGFIVDKSGYILTNNHVVDHATRLQVKLPGDSKQYTAKLIGTDPELDLAVLKIEVDKQFTPLPMGNSDAIETGDWAIAIGSPFGLEQTLTVGIISAKGRSLGEPGHQLQRFLQTDAAINRGNSGGPLLNIEGQVVGINTMIESGSGGFEGIGFALPINLAVQSYNQIIKNGKVSRGAIGVQFAREENASLLKAYGATGGVFVQQVTAGGPASKAGMQAADIIVGINGETVRDGDHLVQVISAAQPGSTVKLKVLRDGKPVELAVKVADRADVLADNGPGGPASPESSEGEAAPAKLGISVQAIDPSDREQIGLTSGGVLVASVQPGSFAEDIGLAQNDVIVSINRQPVKAPADVRTIMQSVKPGDAVAFKLMRNAGGQWASLFIAGTMPNQ